MRFERLRIHNMGVIDDANVDITALPGCITAVVGPNGAGKSSTLEMLMGALTRRCPTRGSLASLARARDSYVEVTVENGARYVLRQQVDAVSGKGQTFIMDEDGRALVESGKVRDADAFIAAHFPAPEVLLSSIFAYQGSTGLLGMSAGDRKKTLLRALQVERLEALADRAREHKRETSATLDTLRARLADERERGGDVSAIEAEIEQARLVAHEADGALTEARRRLEEARAEAAAVEEAIRLAREAAAKRAQLQGESSRLRPDLNQLEVRIANNRELIDRAGEIRAAVARVAELDAVIADANSQRTAAETKAGTARDAAAGHRREAHTAACRAEGAVARAKVARNRLSQRDAIDAAVADIDPLKADVLNAEQKVGEAETALDALRGQRIAGAEERIEGLRDHLGWIIEDDTGAADVLAEQGLDKDDEAVERAQSLPTKLQEADNALRAARDRLAVASRKLNDVQTLAARAPDLEAAERDAGAADREAQTARGEATSATAEAKRVDAIAADCARVAKGHGTAAQNADMERQSVARTAADADHLARAEARIAELEPQAAKARERLAQIETDLAATPEPTPPPPLPDVAAHFSAVEAAEKAAREAHSTVAVTEARLVTARTCATRVDELDKERAALEDELADWTRLAADLGKDGLVAMEIDCAGPEISTLANDLLHGCFGPRFTVRLDTTRLSADGKRQIEDCEITVLDTERGREAPAETLSGGERVIVSEALSLALTVVACRRAGVERPTLVRDESGAALDAENGRAYVAMLRRAADMVGADRVLFVSHSPELWDLADARIELRDGNVAVKPS